MYNNFGMYNNPMPNMNQPYNYTSPYYNNYLNATQQNQNTTTNTNKIYVSGIEDVRNWRLQPNSDVIFLDNDKPLLYQKVIDNKGQFEVKTFKITPFVEEKPDKEDNPNYVEKGEFDALKKEFDALKNKLNVKKPEVINGTTTNGTIK